MIAKPPAGPAAPDAAAFADAHRALLADRSIQFDLPPVEVAEPPLWLKRLLERLAQSDIGLPGIPDWMRSIANFFDNVAPGLGTVFWIVLALVVMAALWAMLRFVVPRLRRRRAGEAAEESWRPAAEPAMLLLGEADELAGRGLYGDAARLLLHRSIADIEERRPDLVRPALTSRDIAALSEIPAPPRSAFARIAMLVERSLFARRPLDDCDWRDCRAAYERFAFADGWRG